MFSILRAETDISSRCSCTRSGGVIRTIAGVDLSAGELDLARRRLEGTITRVHSGLAQSLPMAPDSVDVALCHAARRCRRRARALGGDPGDAADVLAGGVSTPADRRASG